MNSKIKVTASASSWIESKAIDQMEALARLDEVKQVTAMPDLHPGRGIPIGCVTVTEEIVYPHIIGNDIGCGMSLFKADIEMNKFSMDKIVKKLEKLQTESDVNNIGGGNHFAEFQIVQETFVEDSINELKKNVIFLLVHSGSRGLGNQIYQHFIRKHEAQNGIKQDSKVFKQYMELHNEACLKAYKNRLTIAEEIGKGCNISISEKPVLNSMHNYVEEIKADGKSMFVHRKGASSADNGPVIVAGSRGSLTYVVIPDKSDLESGFSIAHGAGRKWNRKESKSKLGKKYTRESIKRTALKSRVVCSSVDLLFEEAPEAYKNIDTVISDLESAGIAKRTASLRPLITYKDRV